MANVGRPPFYNSPEELQIKIDEYFKTGCTIEDVHIKGTDLVIQVKRPTISGLSLYAGFCDRRSFYAYEVKSEFSHTIKKARAKIEQHYEELLQKGLGAGAIFALKNFGWVDKTEVEHSGTPQINVFVQNIINKAGYIDDKRQADPIHRQGGEGLN
uniref:Putative terminase small subunit n=1 Tax=viral metagenome TaxID=1070528 RepID=A0A6M3IYP4_9ZZZZ